MAHRTFATAIVAIVAIATSASAEDAPRRSFVGRKLPDIGFVDTEGHTIRPAHFHGSVLVMITGVPW